MPHINQAEIETVLRRLFDDDLERRAHPASHQVPALGRGVARAKHDMGVQMRLTVLLGDVAHHRDDLGLLVHNILHELLGVNNVKNYDGSWTEYGSLVGVPVAVGA